VKRGLPNKKQNCYESDHRKKEFMSDIQEKSKRGREQACAVCDVEVAENPRLRCCLTLSY
jgi:hypothetical protein